MHPLAAGLDFQEILNLPVKTVVEQFVAGFLEESSGEARQNVQLPLLCGEAAKFVELDFIEMQS